MFNLLLTTIKSALRDKIRLLNFFAVGGLDTIVGYAIFAFMLWLGWHYSLALAGATVFGTLFNFYTTSRLVFYSNDNNRIISFILVYLFVYCINIMSMAILDYIGINPYQSFLLMVFPISLLTYRLNCRYVFKHD